MLALIFVLTAIISAFSSLKIGEKKFFEIGADAPSLTTQPLLYGVETKSDEFVYLSDIEWEQTSYDESKNGGLKRDKTHILVLLRI